MDYRKRIYNKYVSRNTEPLYGKITIEDIKKQFAVWNDYFLKFIPENKQAVIIELGCGNGGLIYWLQSLGYSNTGGIDASTEQVNCAKSFGVENIDEGNILDFIKEKENLYDVIFLRDVLEHFKKEEIINILDMIFRSLKKGGKLIIQTPNSAGIFGGRYRYHDFTHELSFTENSLRQIMLISGFSILEFYETMPVIHSLKSFIRFILWKFLRAVIQFFLLVETGAIEKVLTQNIIAIGYKK